jgi:hypothetical protein
MMLGTIDSNDELVKANPTAANPANGNLYAYVGGQPHQLHRPHRPELMEPVSLEPGVLSDLFSTAASRQQVLELVEESSGWYVSSESSPRRLVPV